MTDVDYDEIARRYIEPAARAMREHLVSETMTIVGITRAEAEIFVSESLSKIRVSPGPISFRREKGTVDA